MSEMGAVSGRRRLMVVEDDPTFGLVIAAYLEAAGFAVTRIVSGGVALYRLDLERWDAVLLDLNLPDEDGLVIARMVRARSTIPIVVVTGRLNEADRLTALELGVDDFVMKPFEPRELVARVRNLLRRAVPAGPEERHVRAGDIRLDTASRLAADGAGREIDLTPAEFDVLLALARAGGRVLSRSQILDAVAKADAPESERAIDVLVARIRRKIGGSGGGRNPIATVRGYGYRAETTRAGPPSALREPSDAL